MKLSTHAQRLERWIGVEEAERISRKMAGWYGPPIPLANVPGKVFATGSGDFVGAIKGGYYASLADYTYDRYKRVIRNWSNRQDSTLNTGFASLSDLITEATTNRKLQTLPFSKTAVGVPTTSSVPLWGVATIPVAGSNAAAAPGGTIPTNTTTGGLRQSNPAGTDTSHLVGCDVSIDTGNANRGTLMLFDYTFGVNTSVNNVAAVVTGVPTRYQTTDAAGSFISARVTTAMNATACLLAIYYMDQDGNIAEAAPDMSLRVSSNINTNPFTEPAWFVPLNAGDTGVRKITNIDTAGANTGVVDWMICHPLAIFPVVGFGTLNYFDGINSAFSLVEIKTGACLAFMTLVTAVGTAPVIYTGNVRIVSG